MAHINTPLLIIAFNRPDELRKVIGALSVHTFRKIYAFVDGPREGVDADPQKIVECRDILSAISFAEEVVTNFRDNNLGCGMSPFTAITEVFRMEEELIILEDDCVPAAAFPEFCEELLIRYREDQRVCMISGSNFSGNCFQSNASYTFSEYSHFGGWAGWKRSWEKVVFDPLNCLNILPRFAGSTFRTAKERRFFSKVYQANFNKPEVNYWDYQASLAFALEGGLSVIPGKNLVSNIGSTGTHYRGGEKYFDLPVPEIFKIESHPVSVKADRVYDSCHFRNHLVPLHRRPLIKKIQNRLRKMFP